MSSTEPQTDYVPDIYWQNTEGSYPHYPTVRHRKRIIGNLLARRGLQPRHKLFDFGCGEGGLLAALQVRFGLAPDRLHGCEISGEAVQIARTRLPGAHIIGQLFPPTERDFDFIICTEVLEHTTEYARILDWIADNLKPGGAAILTTQAGKVHASDRYTGHTQHFKLGELCQAARGCGLEIARARLWGFPLFTLQKYLTDVSFKHVQESFLEGRLTLRKRLVFSLTTLAYYLHDLIPWGPQIIIVAEKPKTSCSVHSVLRHHL